MNSGDSVNTAAGSWLRQFSIGRLVLLISVFLLSLYPGVILCSQTFFFRDYTLFTYPVAWYEHESFWRGEAPLWNPLNNCGIPFLAQWNTSACYPLSLVYMLFPLPWSLNFFLLGHLVLAGVGMYLLAHRWTGNRLAATVAGTAFGLNGLMISCLMWTSNLAALAWEPFVVLLVEQAWRCGGKRRIVLASLAGAMQMLSGAPEIILFTWVLLGVFFLAQSCREQIPVILSAKRIGVIILLVAGLSAVQLLPFFDLLRFSFRDVHFADTGSSSMPPWGWANFLVPFFHSIPPVFGVLLQPKQIWVSSYYASMATLILAAFAIRTFRRDRNVSILVVLTVLSLLFALGDNGFAYIWLKKLLPWIGEGRHPVKFISIAIFTIPMLAAIGLSHIKGGTSGKNERRFLIAAFVLIGLSVLTIIVAARWAVDDNAYPWRQTLRSGCESMLFLTLITLAVSKLINATTERAKFTAVLMIVLVMAVDLLTTDSRLNPVTDMGVFRPIELNMQERPVPGESRAMLSHDVLWYLSSFGSTTNEAYYVIGLRGALFSNSNIPENIPKPDGFFSLHLKNQWETLFAIYDNTNPPVPLMDFLGVSEISSGMFSWQTRTNSMPLATIGQRPLFEDDTNTMAVLRTDRFEPRHMVYLPADAKIIVTADKDDGAEILSKNASPQYEQFSVETTRRTMMVFAQSYYHDWHSYVDGHETPLFRANYSFQAIEVPAGKHEVVLSYEDWMFRMGSIISGLALAGCGLLWFAPRPKQPAA